MAVKTRRPSAPANIDNPILADIRQLSSGTMATLAREFAGCDSLRSRYEFIEKLQADFHKLIGYWTGWPLHRKYETWQDAWADYASYVHATNDGFGGLAARLGFEPDEPC